MRVCHLRLAPKATAENLKDSAWRKRVGFDNIMTTAELELERPIQLAPEKP